ncbi:MAG: Hpt domain-containing protein [Gallionella sp.]|nr:Hpt domain-containing protein [Gallionella sp.]
MNNPAQFDRTTLSAVKPGVDATLVELSTQLDQFLENPIAGKAALIRAQSELHRLLGVFKMVHLDGLAVFCTEYEMVLNELAVTPQITSALHREELRAALTALSRYLDDLAQGADNTTLRLFTQYQQLQQLRGLEMSFDLDLFFPNLAVQLPSSVLSLAQFPNSTAYFKAARGYYQQGLLKYLRQDDVPAALKLMQQAVNVAMSSMPADDTRAFWWICSGLIDCVSRDGLPSDLSAQKALGRVDQQMRSVIAGTPANARPLLNEMLYLIGRSHNVSEIVASIKLTYALDRYFPELTTLSPAELAKNLGVIRELLRSTEEQWELCVQGDAAARTNFMAQAKLIAQQNDALDLNALQYLAQQIAKFSATLTNEENVQHLAMDMAIALLLMGSGISHYRELDRSFQEQVRLLSEHMQSEIDGEPLVEQHLLELVDLYCQTERNDAIFLLSKEMLINLEQTEGGLNGLFGTDSKRDELESVQRWLKQIQGGLQVSSLKHASQLLQAIQETIERFAESDAVIHPVDSRTVASAISQLEGYLEQLPNGHEDQVDGLQLAMEELAKLRQPEPIVIPATLLEIPEVESAVVAQPSRSSEDQELLEIFLEEATEVLEIMRANHEISQLEPTNREALVTIRRGFHTLKGSGRMVGLVEIGEVAWVAESAMNKWLQDNKPASPDLLRFIEQAIQHFAAWVDTLGAKGYANVQAEGLVKFAQRIEAAAIGQAAEVARPAAPVAIPAEPVVAVPSFPVTAPAVHPVKADTSDTDMIHIGDKVLSTTLFKIGSEEAKQHASALRVCFNELKNTPSLLIQYDFMRAAHTLAGVNRAMGFSAIVELAFALESWLQSRIEQPSVLREVEKPLLDGVISALEDMTQRLCNQVLPTGRDDLVVQLRQSKEPLGNVVTPEASEPVEMVAPITLAPVEEIAFAAETPVGIAMFAPAPTAPVSPMELVSEAAPAEAADTFATFYDQVSVPAEEIAFAAEAPVVDVEMFAPVPAEPVAPLEFVSEVAPVKEVDAFAGFFDQVTAPAEETTLNVEAPEVDSAMFTAMPAEPVAPLEFVSEVAPVKEVDAFAGFFDQVTAPAEETTLNVEAPEVDSAMFTAMPAEPVAPLEFVSEVAPVKEVDAFAGFFDQVTAPAEETTQNVEAPEVDLAMFTTMPAEPVAPLEFVSEVAPVKEVDAFAGFFDQVTAPAEETTQNVEAPEVDLAMFTAMPAEPVAPLEFVSEVAPVKEVDAFAGFFDQVSAPVEAIAFTAEAHEVDAPKFVSVPVEQVATTAAIIPAQEVVDVVPVVAAPVSATAITPLSTPSQLNIGGRVISRTLFSVGSDETRQNVLVLRRCFNELRASATQVVQYDFMRAAHTIVGVNRAMGFSSVVDLAVVLESWLQARIDQPSVLHEAEAPLLNEVVVALEEMTQQLCNQEFPLGRDDLVSQLRLAREPLTVGSAPVVSEVLTVLPPDAGAVEASEAMVADDVIAALFEQTTSPVVSPPQNAAPAAQRLELVESAVQTIEVAPETASGEEDMFAALFAPAETAVQPALNDAVLDIAKLFEPTAPVKAAPVSKVEQNVASSTQNVHAPQHAGTLEQGVGEETDISQVRDDVDEQLLPVFLEEADELMPKVSECLRAWREMPTNEQQSNLLKRLLHTMKGSSRMAGAMRIGELSHEMESRVLAVAKLSNHEGYWDGLEHELDRVSGLIEELRTGKPSPLEVVISKAKEESSEEIRVEVEETSTHNEEQSNRRSTERVAWGNMLRVRADVVDRLVNEAGEISVTRSRMETELRIFKDSLMELTGSVTRLRQQLREVEIQAESQMQARITLSQEDNEHFDPLEFDRFTRLQELTRFMNESVHDVQTVQQTLLKNLDETAAAMSAQARLNRDLQQRLMNVRMVPFNSISERLYRIVRQTGKDLKKRANLELQGGHVELDRGVLEKMTAPFEHLLRNSIAHGLESETERAKTNKPTIGEIRLSLHQENNEVVFEISDDGKGLNFEALRNKAISLGFGKPGEVLSEQQLAQLIFVSGVSTATEVSAVAGRGIGMDVVRSEIAGLGGRIDVSSVAGVGTRFTVHLPLTLAVMQTVMVRSGESIFAIPATMVEQVVQLKTDAMTALHQSRHLDAQGHSYPLHYLPTLLGDENHVVENHLRNSILLLRSSEQRIALHVDELLGRQEAVVKNIGPQLARLIGVAGATVRGDGAVVLILNPVQMAQRVLTTVHKVNAAEPVALRTQPLVMVVDDSLTVRKITSRLLLRAGYQVATATDGVNALEQLSDITPDVMLLDVEMPRMDGFELTKNIRRNERMKQFPIIMITSRTADKHRDYAFQLGVNAYLGKPYQEEDLLSRIAAFVEAAHA